MRSLKDPTLILVCKLVKIQVKLSHLESHRQNQPIQIHGTSAWFAIDIGDGSIFSVSSQGRREKFLHSYSIPSINLGMEPDSILP